jgi:glycine/D-amino acid oxidase-like deaminating enzyme
MFDVCIVGGGGVVGCAIAREAAQHGLSLVALERHTGLCKETSASIAVSFILDFMKTPAP